jgi:hypothetical protein
MRKDRWVLILGCMAAPLACAQQHAVAASAQLSRPAAPPASRNPIGQALADLLRQARPAPQAPADQAAVAQPASSALAPAQGGTAPQAHADASAVSSTPAANAVVVNH